MSKLTAIFLLIISAICCVALPALAQKNQVNWLSLSEAENALADTEKPVLIDLYTDWCVWCKVMDRKTYTNKNLVNYVQEKFYSVKVNAESKAAIKWKGRTFNFSPTYKVNEFSLYVTNGRLAFPTTVVILPGEEEPKVIAGYLKPREIELFLKYFGEKANSRMSFEAFQKQTKASW